MSSGTGDDLTYVALGLAAIAAIMSVRHQANDTQQEVLWLLETVATAEPAAMAPRLAKTRRTRRFPCPRECLMKSTWAVARPTSIVSPTLPPHRPRSSSQPSADGARPGSDQNCPRLFS
jgi:hypothetical protein